MKFNPRTHIPAPEAAKRLGHSRRWLGEKLRSGELEGFRHSSRDITVSLESIIAYEHRTRMNRRLPS